MGHCRSPEVLDGLSPNVSNDSTPTPCSPEAPVILPLLGQRRFGAEAAKGEHEGTSDHFLVSGHKALMVLVTWVFLCAWEGFGILVNLEANPHSDSRFRPRRPSRKN